MTQIAGTEILLGIFAMLGQPILGLVAGRYNLPGVTDRTLFIHLALAVTVQTNRHPGG